MALAVACVVSACSSGESGNPGSTPGDGRSFAPPTEQIVLTEVFRVGLEDPLFGRISDIEIGPDRTVYVADSGSESVVHRFDQTGRYLGPLGAKGDGPGEYGRPNLVIATADSIVLHDGYYGRILTYEPDGTPRRRTDRHSTVTQENPTSVSLGGMLGVRYVGFETPVALPGMEGDLPEHYVVRFINADATAGDSLWTVRSRKILTISTDRSVRMRAAPFGAQTHCVFGIDRAYCAWGGALEFDTFDEDGNPIDSWSVAYNPVDIPEAEKASVRENIGEDFLPLLELPDHYPAIEGLAMDDSGHLWIRVRVEHGGAGQQDPDAVTTSTWVVDPDGGHVREVILDGNVTIHAIRGSRACGLLVDQAGEQSVVCYSYPGGQA